MESSHFPLHVAGDSAVGYRIIESSPDLFPSQKAFLLTMNLGRGQVIRGSSQEKQTPSLPASLPSMMPGI